jgi:TRAP-type mannitol/chloroaromatic compound transport system substrate-binding protein
MIPGMFTFDEAVTWFYSDDLNGKAKAEEMFHKFNLHWLMYQSNVVEAEYLSNKEIKTVADFKGLKFRGTGWSTKVVNEMGASGVMMPYQDVYSALERGLIDACEVGTPSGNWDLKFHEVVKYQGFPGIHKLWETAGIMINLDTWNKLPKDLQVIFEMACTENFVRNAAFGWWDSVVAIEKQKAYGMKMVVETPELQKYWRDTAWRMADDIGKTDAAWKALWDPMKDFMTRMGVYEKLQTPNYGP